MQGSADMHTTAYLVLEDTIFPNKAILERMCPLTAISRAENHVWTGT
jgi:hypothetical protein